MMTSSLKFLQIKKIQGGNYYSVQSLSIVAYSSKELEGRGSNLPTPSQKLVDKTPHNCLIMTSDNTKS